MKTVMAAGLLAMLTAAAASPTFFCSGLFPARAGGSQEGPGAEGVAKPAGAEGSAGVAGRSGMGSSVTLTTPGATVTAG